MKLRNFGRVTALLAAAALWVGVSTSANAIVWDLGSVFSGTVNPGSVSVAIEPTASGVTLTVDTGGLTYAGSFLGSLYLNYSGTLPLTFGDFAVESGDVTAPTILQSSTPAGNAAYKADGEGFYNIVFEFATSAAAGRFDQGESVSWTIAGATEGAFNVLSYDGSPGAYDRTGYYAAAHVQGIPVPGGTTSSWTTVPEPTTVIAGALLLLPFGVSTLRILLKRKV